MALAVWDLDGCLIDNKFTGDFTENHLARLNDPPNQKAIEWFRKQSVFLKMMVLTARPWSLLEVTQSWLERQNIRADLVFCRPVEVLHHCPPTIQAGWKREVLLKISSRILLHDDQLEVLRVCCSLPNVSGALVCRMTTSLQYSKNW